MKIKSGEPTSQGQLVLFSERPRRKKKARLPPQMTKPTGKRSRVPHETRPDVNGPVHVVWRIERGLPGLRTPRALRQLERAFRRSKEQKGFALTHYSIQADHLHLVVEVPHRRKLARALQVLGIRIAKALNSLWHRKKGNVFAERYFAAAMTSVRQMFRTVRYVLNNGRKHGTWTVKGQPDPYSSGPWFCFWRERNICRPLRSSPVMESRRIASFFELDVDEAPGPRWHEFVSEEPLRVPART